MTSKAVQPDRTFRLVTLGCKVNQYESAFLEESFLQSGWRRAERGEAAGVVVVNTCLVTGRAAYQSRQAVRRLIRENPGALAVVTGCYAQVSPEALSEIPGVHLVAGNTYKGRLPGLVQSRDPSDGPVVLRESLPEHPSFEVLPVQGHPGRTRALLKVQDGCSSYCSYCIVPYARGRPCSMGVEDAVRAVRRFARAGFREVVLTGIHLGRYGCDLGPGTDLKVLLRRIGRSRLPVRIRLSSLEPDEVDRELVDLVASDPGLCRHVHLAMQSGDTGVLSRMNRGYTAETFAGITETIRRVMPDAAVGADVLVGFPGESPEAFERTRRLVKRLPLTYLHVFRYSPRPGTPAARFRDAVPHAEAGERAAVMRSLGREKRRAFLRSCLGTEAQVLVESLGPEDPPVASGLSSNYVPVSFPAEGAKPGEVVRVVLDRLEDDQVSGRRGSLDSEPARGPETQT